MGVQLYRNIGRLVSMDDDAREFHNVDMRVVDGVIGEIGQNLSYDDAAIVEMNGAIVTPGLVNTHHHMFQSLVRTVPAGQDALLFGWLKTLYPIFATMRPHHIMAGVQTAVAELLLSGCTMSSDHQYIFPNGARLEHSIEAARALGIRFHATRGSMSIGESAGGLPPDFLVENEEAIIKDTVRVIDAFHDPRANAKVRVAVAPTSPFTVSHELMRDSAILARDKGVMMHTHLAENVEDIDYSLARFGQRPGDYAQDLGWVGADVWHAHCVQLDDAEIALFARTLTGVAHCPCSNCRLGSGIAPVRKMRDSRVKVGLGVDGSASNDSGHILQEARQAMLLQRVAGGADKMSAREALRIATRGGAEVLGRGDELGQLRVGYRADFAVFDLNDFDRVDNIGAAGAWDPVAALVLCGPFRPKMVVVDGEIVVEDYRLTKAKLHDIQANQAQAVRELMAG